MKLSHLSPNLIQIVNHTIENKDLMKLVVYDYVDPLTRLDINNPQSWINNRILPYPYNKTLTEQQTQVRIFYGKSKLNTIENTPIIFEIITHNELYFVDSSDSSSKLLRLYEIANRITEQFDKQSIGTIGVIHFNEAIPIPLDNEYQMLRLVGQMMTIGK